MKKNCRVIVFSKNRALQCHLALSSLLRHCSDLLKISDVYVLYDLDKQHEKSYQTLMSEFPQVNFLKEKNFKNDLLELVHKSNISSILFCVDDTIFTEDFSMEEVISALVENDDCLGFSLRLGKNCVKCFPYNCEQKVPETEKVSKNILKYNWQKAEYDFGYSLELSSSCYRLKDLEEILIGCSYDSPNSLESCMASCIIEDKPNLLMFEKSPCFCAPLNRVQSTHPNRNAGHDPDTFRLMYEKGLRIDAKQFDDYISHAAHEIPENIEVININEVE